MLHVMQSNLYLLDFCVVTNTETKKIVTIRSALSFGGLYRWLPDYTKRDQESTSHACILVRLDQEKSGKTIYITE